MKALAPKLTWILALASILLVSLACNFNFNEVRGIDPGSAVELPPDFPTEVEASGEGERVPASPTPDNENSSQLPLTECLAPTTAFQLSYDIQKNSGEANRSCSADLILVNTSNERLAISLHETFDNNAVRADQWKHYRLEPGAQIQKHMTHAEYQDGTVTYNLVKNVFVTWATPACAWIQSEENMSIWEDRSQQIDLPCN